MVIGAVGGFDNGLQGFLADLLGNLVDALVKQTGGVRTLGHLVLATVDERLQLTQKQQRIALIVFAPAGVGTCVARRTYGIHAHQQGVVVAVYLHVHEIQEVTAGLSLGPQRLTRTAPEGDVTSLNGLAVGFLVHEAQHQHVPGRGILDDGWHQTVHLVEIYVHCFFSLAL